MERLYLYQSKTNAFIKKLWLLATFLVFALQANAQCPPGDVELHSVYDLEQFWIQYPNCTQITGTLQLGHLSADYDLTNFSIENFLSQLQSVGGLKIYRTNLTNLNGLSNLTNINGVLDIRNNNYLLNISGLQNVNANGITNLNIQSNFSLYNCHIATVCSYLQGSGGVNISNNAGCHSVAEVAQACLPPCVAPTSVTSSGIAPNKATINWTSSGSTFDLEWGMVGFTQGTGTTQNGVSALNYQITGLSAITSYDVYVRQNCTGNQSGWVKHTFSTTSCEAPTSITFSNITQANATIKWFDSGTFDLEWGTAGFTQGTGTVQNGISSTNYQIGGLSIGTSYDVYIRQNCTTSQSTWVKRTFSTLGVCPTGNVELYSQADLDHFVATYPNCTQISGSLWIQGSGITSLMPLNSIQSVGGDLTIRDIQSNLSGFSSLTSVNGDLVIWENPQLTNLNGLTSLTSINGKLEIFHNLQLTNISGIQNVNTGISELRILYNSNLSTCNVASVCTYLEGSGDRNIAGNATGCEDVSAIAFSCIPACVEAAGVTFSTIVSDQATINWTNSGTFDLEWGTTGFAQGTGTAQNGVSALYYQITGLSPSTSYDVYVRQNCTINQSDWVKYTFSTISCAVPAGITSSNIVSDKATLNWTNPGTFDLEWGTTGFAQGTGTAQNGVSASHYQITGLSASTSYDVYVRQNCTSNQSDWVKHTFSTISTCPSGNVLLRTQQEVNAFGAMYPNCTEISGAMTINNTSNISDLSPLGTITSIGGFLVINNTYSGLHGLSSLTSVGGYLTISSNHNLYNLNQLSSLASIGGDLQIQNNGNLNNISGLQHVSGITNLVITNNQSLSVCTIESVCNYLNGVGYYYGQISGNAEGCENKDVVKSACPAAPQLECPTGNFWLTSQYAVNEFSLYNCTVIEGDLAISDSVTDLSVLNSIVSITGNLNISTTNLTSINGLSSLTSIGGSLYMGSNSQLTNLNGLSSLTSVGGAIYISSNSKLTDLDGLSSLESINGALYIDQNNQLTDISALQNLSGIQTLTINSNQALSVCNINSVCNYLYITGGQANISGNDGTCSSPHIVSLSCCAVPASITSSNIVSDKATINWTNSGIFDLEWGTANFKENSLPSLGTQTGVSALNYTITGLSASTSYDVYIRQNCTDNQSIWVKYTFSTVSVCPSGNVNLLSQADVAHFAATYPNCTEIEGNLFISGYPNGITDISPLQHITSIGGELEINSSKLVDLDGLSNLTSVGGRIALVSNHNLVDISGLSTIDPSSITGYGLSIHGNLSLTACNIESFCSYLSGSGPRNIYGNKADCFTDQAILVTCDPLVAQDCEGDVLLNSQMAVDAFMANNPGCTHISGNLTISGDGITNLSSLNAVTSIGGNLTIKNTTILYNLTGLGSVNSIGGELFLETNARLQDITALTSLNSVGGLSIYQNPLLSSINVFGPITSVNGSIFIGENNVLGSLQGLQNLTHVGQYLMVTENNLITNLDPLANVESVGNALHVTRNQSLTNIDGLNGITTIVGGLVIAENPLLVDIDSLSGLTTIGDGILIRANNLLENLNGLSGVTTFAGDVSIYENPQLNTISGLENIDYTTIYNVKIENNPLVSVCNLENLCSYFADFSNPRTVSGNATGCEDMNAIYTACNIAPPSCPLDPIEFYSQEDVDNFVVLYPNCTAFPFGLYIEGNDITDLSPLNNIESINGSLFIVETGLEHLNDLDGLTSINGEIVITNNLSLTTIAGLQNIAPESIIDDWQGLVIADNPQLSLCSLNNLCTYLSDYDNQRTISGNATGCGESELNALCGIVCPPPGDISFSSQEDLNAFGAMFPNCTQIDGNLEIYGDEITDLSPLSNIQTVQGGLSIYDTSLTHVNGLSNLTAVNGAWFGVSGNSLLEDISGFSNVNLNNLNPIDMEYDGLYVGYNPLLSVCNIPNFCDYLSNDPATHPRLIENNAEGCENVEVVANKCFAGNCESYTIWNGASWSNGTPDNTKRVIVRNDLTVSSDMIACELLLESGIVNVNTGTTFTVEGEIHNKQSADHFIVQSDANLIQLHDVENIGTITVKRNSFPLYRQDYTLWSSPVAGQNLRNFSPATLFNRFTSYDPSLGSNGEYVQEIVTTADMNTKTFIDAKGYMIRMPNNWPVFVNEATPGTPFPGVFKGIPNNGTVSIPLSFANSGLNLVGNPYPSSISIEGLFDANPDIQRVLYFWRKRNDMSGSGYATYTALGLTSVQNEINGLDLQNTIKPGQGFFVKSNGVTSLNFDNQMRISGQNGHFLRNGNTIEKHRFWLNLSLNNQVLGQTLIGYVSGATSGVDNGIDAAYFNDSALALTSLIDDAEYIIQGKSLPFAASDVVPLGFKSDVAGNFTISLSNFDGLFADDQAIYLKDNATGTLHDLKSADYSFTAPTGVFNDRFEVQYNTTLGTNNPVAHNAILIGVQNQKIQINAGTIVMDRVELIDVMGRIIYTQGVVNATSVLLENIVSSNQVLLVRISTKEHGIVTQKIIF